MTFEEIKLALKETSDDDLIKLFLKAKDDLKEASETQHESEWHESCFAAVIVFSQEIQRRNLKIPKEL